MKGMIKVCIYCMAILLSINFVGCRKSNPQKDVNNNVPDDSDVIGNLPPISSSEDISKVALKNIWRAMEVTDAAISNYFEGNGMKISNNYNPYTEVKSDNIGSVWEYTASIEAVNAILSALIEFKKKGAVELYDEYFKKYTDLLDKLYENIFFYEGTYTLTSYTQTKEWTVFGVHRASGKGMANVEGKENVYDDQQWLIRELILAYKLTNDEKYLTEGEYLTGYVLDGWDCTLDHNGKEYGGVTWGPGYTSKHSCSNGPFISPLVWLSEIYKDKSDELSFKIIDTDQKRISVTRNKSEFYLDYANRVYQWQKKALLLPRGVYNDMRGGGGDVKYIEVNGVTYRKHADLPDNAGPAISYNSGSMLSGAADLFNATHDLQYLEDAKSLTDASFKEFAKLDQTVQGYYTYDISGNRNWFNNVLLRGYLDVNPLYDGTEEAIQSFQNNLDYGYDKFFYKGMLPSNLLVGWSKDNSNNKVDVLWTFAFASEYARLAQYQLK